MGRAMKHLVLLLNSGHLSMSVGPALRTLVCERSKCPLRCHVFLYLESQNHVPLFIGPIVTYKRENINLSSVLCCLRNPCVWMARPPVGSEREETFTAGTGIGNLGIEQLDVDL